MIPEIRRVARHQGDAAACRDDCGGHAELNLTTVQLATCAVLFSAATLFFGDSLPQFALTSDVGGAALFLYLVLVCTVFAFFVQTWAVRRTSPSRVSLLLGTEPIWAALIGIAIAHDRVAPVGYVGIALILAGTMWGRSVDAQIVERSPVAQPATNRRT